MTTEKSRDDEEPTEESDAMIVAPQLPGPQTPEVARARHLGSFAILDHPVVSAEEAFKLLRIDRTTGYKAIREGTFPLPVLRIGRVIRIPTAALVQLLELEIVTDAIDHSREQQS